MAGALDVYDPGYYATYCGYEFRDCVASFLSIADSFETYAEKVM